MLLWLAVVLAFSLAIAAPAGAAAKGTPRCCTKLPFTGLPLYLPVLASLGLIGAGVALRVRAREV